MLPAAQDPSPSVAFRKPNATGSGLVHSAGTGQLFDTEGDSIFVLAAVAAQRTASAQGGAVREASDAYVLIAVKGMHSDLHVSDTSCYIL